MRFLAFASPPEPYSHWAACPTSGEPILMFVEPAPAAPDAGLAEAARMDADRRIVEEGTLADRLARALEPIAKWDEPVKLNAADCIRAGEVLQDYRRYRDAHPWAALSSRDRARGGEGK